MIIHTFYQRSSLHFTHHFSLPYTFRRIIITLQIPSLHFTSLQFTSIHFTSLIITFLTLFLKTCTHISPKIFTSLHSPFFTTHHFSLPYTFRRIIITLQIPSLHFNSLHITYNYFSNPLFKNMYTHFTKDFHFTSLH